MADLDHRERSGSGNCGWFHTDFMGVVGAAPGAAAAGRGQPRQLCNVPRRAAATAAGRGESESRAKGLRPNPLRPDQRSPTREAPPTGQPRGGT
ncbi:MAG: hypothetical protein ACK5PF_02990 [bacterium]